MKHCKGCSHPTICNTHGCEAEEARANKAKAELKAQLGVSKFTGVAERKLTGLIVEDGFTINGVAIRNDKTGQQGFVTNGGVVGWWRPENDAQMIRAQLDELLEALRLAVDHLDMTALEISHCKDAARIRAAIAKAEGGAA